MVDTCAAEFEAVTPYFYSTYEEENEAPPLDRPSERSCIGSGPIRIGQGIEFDYCSVQAAWALHDAGVASIMINSNPETVSTDFDTSDRLYFEPLDARVVSRDPAARESQERRRRRRPSAPCIVQFGGQTAINLAEPLDGAGVPILGSGCEAIDLAEDRERFEAFLAELGIPQPPGAGRDAPSNEALAIAEPHRLPGPRAPVATCSAGGRWRSCYDADELVRYYPHWRSSTRRAGPC